MKIKKFRLPRKTKKKIGRGFYFYPMDPINKTYLVAWPKDSQEDYDAWRNGELIDLKKQLYAKTEKEN